MAFMKTSVMVHAKVEPDPDLAANVQRTLVRQGWTSGYSLHLTHLHLEAFKVGLDAVEPVGEPVVVLVGDDDYEEVVAAGGSLFRASS